MANDGNWFAPKRFGYGAGLPIAWQGWVVLLAYAAVMIAMARGVVADRHWAMGVMLAATAVLMLVCSRHTRGGWRWRWGAE